MKTLLAIFLLVSITVSCGRKNVPQVTGVDKRDSSTTVIQYVDRSTIKDSLIYLPADSSWLKALIECDSLGNARLVDIQELKNGKRFYAPDVKVKSNQLTVNCKADSLAIFYRLKERYKDLFVEDRQVKKEVITKMITVNKLTWWQRTQINLFRILGGGLLLFIGGKILQSKFKLPFKK